MDKVRIKPYLWKVPWVKKKKKGEKKDAESSADAKWFSFTSVDAQVNTSFHLRDWPALQIQSVNDFLERLIHTGKFY